MPEGQVEYLSDPSPENLESAVAWNHRELFVLGARAAGGEAVETGDVTWTYSGPDGDSMILFPQISDAEAGARLDDFTEFYLCRQVNSLVGCWSLVPPQPRDLEVRLLARGFQIGWQPCWMWLDLQNLNLDHPRPEGLTVGLVDPDDIWDVDDLPYYRPEIMGSKLDLSRARPQRYWRFGAWLDGMVVGHASVFLTTGPLGVAGIYSVGVVPRARGQGVGKAVTGAACRHASMLGCRYAMLNGTGEKMYRQLGFEKLGYGLTWWLNVPRLAERRPTPERVALTEAVGRGDPDEIASLLRRWDFGNLDVPLPNGMTLVQLAVHTGHSQSVECLLDHGAALDVVSAWDLGWKDRVPRLLADRPDLANLLTGEREMTPLHTAVDRNDIELARVVLASHPDLTVQDPEYHSTAEGWARYLGRTEILRLIEAN